MDPSTAPLLEIARNHHVPVPSSLQNPQASLFPSYLVETQINILAFTESQQRHHLIAIVASPSMSTTASSHGIVFSSLS
ncbi:hypothetical protein COLO4_21405 [Corchorus olitorius]|uniref:Uncharacterized protein n=1 Tax=Corchorus olitorius TaxID=93759 RepID=A0A1R3ITG4_9ROSI|nr:hypothetical protein COLO4_21405 [Corchorus olitorius]